MFKEISLLIVLGICLGGTIKYNRKIVELQTNDFDKFLGQNQYVFVRFYDKKCGECKEFAQTYQDLANKIDFEVQEKAQVAQIDLLENEEITYRYMNPIQPTIYMFFNGMPIVYNGQKDVASMLNYTLEIMKEKQFKKIQQDFEFQELKDKFENFVLFLDSSDEFKKTVLSYMQLVYKDIQFLQISKNLKKISQFSDNTEFKLFYEGDTFDYNDILHWNKSQDFINKSISSDITNINEDNIEVFVNQKKFSAFLIYQDIVEKLKFKKIFQNLQKSNLKENVSMGLLIQESDLNNILHDITGFPRNQSFIFLEIVNENLLKYFYEGSIDENSISQWIQKVLNAQVNQFLKSEEIPEINDDACQKWVGKNFLQNIDNIKRDLIIYVHNEDCNDCTQTIKIFQHIAQNLEKSNPNIVFALFNNEKNDLDNKFVQENTLIYIKENEKIDWIEQKEPEQNSTYILNFIKNHSTNQYNETEFEFLEDKEQKDMFKGMEGGFGGLESMLKNMMGGMGGEGGMGGMEEIMKNMQNMMKGKKTGEEENLNKEEVDKVSQEHVDIQEELDKEENGKEENSVNQNIQYINQFHFQVFESDHIVWFSSYRGIIRLIFH